VLNARPTSQPEAATVEARASAREQRRQARESAREQSLEENMLFTVAVVLIVLWALGLLTSYTMGGLVHILLVVAVVVVLVRVIQGRRLTG
jgi:Flp pilus assembly protein TadB